MTRDCRNCAMTRDAGGKIYAYPIDTEPDDKGRGGGKIYAYPIDT
jgi:hypothetical protein